MMFDFLKSIFRKEEKDYRIVQCEYSSRKILLAIRGWKPHHEKILRENEIRAISLFCPGPRIDYVRELPDLLGFETYGSEIEDITPIMAHPNLKLLGIPFKFRPKMDISEFRHLEVLKGEWQKSMTGFEHCSTLRYLNLVKYPYEDLNPLSSLSNLHSLFLSSNKLRCLDGIMKLAQLTELDLYNCPNLESAYELDKHPRLKRIEIERCGDALAAETLTKRG